ncbi:TPA: DUF1642 domain-containing protein [Streptococcus suis]|nr:DUF1642 domain-containing protein [Streptococcus suis]
MKQNDFYEVNGCTEFIPVTINERYNDGVDVTIHGPIRPFRTTVEQVYQFQKPHEPQKVVIPMYVSEWIGQCKALRKTFYYAITTINMPINVGEWLGYSKNAEIFVHAWLYGYEIEQEKLYTVELFNGQPLVEANNVLYFSSNLTASNAHVSKDKLEKAGFGWVFDCKGVKVVEVKE